MCFSPEADFTAAAILGPDELTAVVHIVLSGKGPGLPAACSLPKNPTRSADKSLSLGEILPRKAV